MPSTETKPRILVTDSSVSVPKLREIADIYQHNKSEQMPREELLEKIGDVHAIFCTLRDKLDKSVLDKAKNLRMIGTMSVGYDHIDVDECKKRGIAIGYTPDVVTEATAELGMALLLATSRRLPEAIKSASSGGWKDWDLYYMCGKAIMDSTIGIYGMGKIGSSFAEKLLPFKPRRILYHNRSVREDYRKEFIYVKKFDDLVKESDFLLICATPNSENEGVFNKKIFEKMKKDSILINISRGVLVNQTDLYEALKDGVIGAAGLDVTTPEPLPNDNPLFQLPNCVILPHIGSANYPTRSRMASITEDNIRNFLCGKTMIAELKI